jgi:ABC-type Fe3+ transport system permease subunit
MHANVDRAASEVLHAAISSLFVFFVLFVAFVVILLVAASGRFMALVVANTDCRGQPRRRTQPAA